jgi:hypothetical protein
MAKRRKQRKNVSLDEAWLDGNYYAVFADGDIGDQNHEMVAFESAVGLDADTCDRLYREYKITIDANGIDVEALGKVYAEENEIEITDDTNLEELGREWFEENGGNLEFLDWGGDARSYMMKKENWVRVAGSSFQVHEFNADALDNIRRSDLFEHVETDDEEEPHESEDEVWIEELSAGESYVVMLRQLLDDSLGVEGLKAIARGEESIPSQETTPVFKKHTQDAPGVDKWLYRRIGDNPGFEVGDRVRWKSADYDDIHEGDTATVLRVRPIGKTISLTVKWDRLKTKNGEQVITSQDALDFEKV